jgi:hypothetical protein
MPNVLIDSIVAASNKEPYVRLVIDNNPVLQLTMSQARKLAKDFYLAASRAEADAMILRFFAAHDLPEQAAGALLVDFRDFRLGLDLDKPEEFYSDPDAPSK